MVRRVDARLAVGVAARVGVVVHCGAWLRVWAWPWGVGVAARVGVAVTVGVALRGCKAQFSASPRSFPGLPIEFFSLPKSRFISLETSRYP